MNELKVAIAQLNFLVGDIQGNTDKIIDTAMKARDALKADVIVFSELCLIGYPPDDLLLKRGLAARIDKALNKILHAVQGIHLIVSYPKKTAKPSRQNLLNTAAVLFNGNVIAEYYKHHLPNYQVFDEKRYFESGEIACVVNIKNFPIGLTICEDVWQAGPVERACESGAKLIINLNASPFHAEKFEARVELLQRVTTGNRVPLVYVNQVGGQDELIFDGTSMVFNQEGEITALLPSFTESLTAVSFQKTASGEISPVKTKLPPIPSIESRIYQSLVLAVRDYVTKNRFNGVIIGLSGGIDSALTLAIAVDALGKDQVEAVLMPSAFTATMSMDDAIMEAKSLEVNYHIIPINPMVESFQQALNPVLGELGTSVTAQNIQARTRGVLLMAISNKTNRLVLTTGNKSEMAVGYATLYGDMAGGFDVLKDVPKTMVYRLAEYRNRLTEVIPPSVIARPPTAELAPNQLDENDLPPYAILDQIIELYVDQDESAEAIIKKGFDVALVQKIVGMIDRNEYKRRQAPVGARISEKAFGRDRRYPITSGWRIVD